jgi:hypothetical protein
MANELSLEKGALQFWKSKIKHAIVSPANSGREGFGRIELCRFIERTSMIHFGTMAARLKESGARVGRILKMSQCSFGGD